MEKDTGDKFKNIENLLNNEINKARKKEMKINPLPWELKKELQENYDKWNRSAIQVKTEIKNQINKKDYNKANEICQVCLEQCNSFIKNYTDKIKYINEGQRSITSNQLLLSKSEKETGNNFMKSQSLPEAIKHYTYSIISNPSLQHIVIDH